MRRREGPGQGPSEHCRGATLGDSGDGNSMPGGYAEDLIQRSELAQFCTEGFDVRGRSIKSEAAFARQKLLCQNCALGICANIT